MPTNSTTVIGFIDHLIEECRPGAFRLRWEYGALMRHLASHAGTNRIDFLAVTKPFVAGFADYLASKGNQPSTRVKAIRLLKRIVILAGEAGITTVPFPRWHIRVPEIVRRRLSLEQIKRLDALVIPKDTILWHSKNLYVGSFFLGGVRVHDMLTLRWDSLKGGYVQFVASKTGKLHRLLLLPEALAVLERYAERRGKFGLVFPLLVEPIEQDPKKLAQLIMVLDQKINNSLRELSAALHLEPFCMHSSRHSLADHLAKQAMPIRILQRVLSHSSVAVTERYLSKLGSEEVSEAYANAFHPKETTK
jgi:integrase